MLSNLLAIHTRVAQIKPPVRKSKRDTDALLRLFEQPALKTLTSTVHTWAAEQLGAGKLRREGIWSEAVIVGDEEFIRLQHERNRSIYPGLKIVAEGDSFILREPAISYSWFSIHQMTRLSAKTAPIKPHTS